MAKRKLYITTDGELFTDESSMQTVCIKTYTIQFAQQHFNNAPLFAIPNGGYRTGAEAKQLKGEGVLDGVADAFLSYPNNDWHGLYIEFKTPVGEWSKHQKVFAESVIKQGYGYALVRRVSDFEKLLTAYAADMYIQLSIEQMEAGKKRIAK